MIGLMGAAPGRVRGALSHAARGVCAGRPARGAGGAPGDVNTVTMRGGGPGPHAGGMAAKKKLKVQVRRVYEEPRPDDGARVLVDRVWPRGESKERAALDDWNKDVAPSTELRKWYRHDPELFDEFAERYRAELATEEGEQGLDRLLRTASGAGTLTLLTANKDLALAHTRVLEEELGNRI